jgi:hypothetical protein
MSISGQQRLELEQARVEALRIEQVRAECAALAAACEAAIRSVRDIAVQQFVAAELHETAQAIAQVRQQVAATPDIALPVLGAIQMRIQQAIAHAQARAQAWTETQASTIARARAVQEQARARAAATAAGDLAGKSDSAQRLASEAVVHAEAGRIEEAERLCVAAGAASRTAVTEVLDERVRRELVRGLLQALKDMGFVVAARLSDQGFVVLDGRLASGRRARFEVNLDGHMAFDLDGYEGRACADDMQKVEVTLRDRFGVKLGPPQVVWKNPDRLSQSAQEVPAGAQNKRR